MVCGLIIELMVINIMIVDRVYFFWIVLIIVMKVMIIIKSMKMINFYNRSIWIKDELI